MKILYVITGLTLGGAETQLFNLASRLKKDIDLRVVNFYGGYYVQKLKELGVDTKTIKINSKLNFIKAIRELKYEIEKEKPHIVHSFLPHSNIICKITKIFCRHKFKLICSIRVKEIRFIMQNLGERFLDFSCNLITTNSKTTKNFLVNKLFYKKDKIKVIYNGFDFKEAKAKKLFPGKRKVITVANFRQQKDYLTNVETCEKLSEIRKDFVFLYAGTGQLMDKIKRIVNRKKINKFIRFLGPRKDIPELLKSCEVFFLPTLYEGQSNAVIEAMHYKCPIVTTNIPENREIAVNGKEALLIKVKSPEKMAIAINELINNQKLRQELMKNTYEKSKKFDINKMIKNYKKIYNELKCVG